MKTISNIALMLTLSSGVLHAQRPVGDSLPLYYDVSSGNVTIDTTEISGGEFVSYTVSKLSVNDRVFLSENHTPFMNGVFAAESTPKSLGETTWPGEPLEPGVYSLGNILPAGLEEEDLDLYFGETGHRSVPDDRSNFTYIAYGSFDADPALYHVFDINYSPSPYPPLNDGNPPPVEDVVWATEASLAYDPADGSLYLDTSGPNGGRAFGYEIRLGQDVIRTDQFTHITSETFAVINPNTIAESTQIDAGYHDLGSILPPDLEFDQLDQLILSADFIGEPGHGKGALDFAVSGRQLSLSIVPEPQVNLIGMLVLGALLRLKRKISLQQQQSNTLMS